MLLPPLPRALSRGSFLRSFGLIGASVALVAAMPAATQSGIGHPYRLNSTRGTVVTDRTYLGKVQVVMFGFVSCPDICPMTLSSLSQGLSLMGTKRKDVQILFISVDRERDTMPMLKTYVQAFAPETLGLTGSKSQIDGAVRAFRARYAIDGKGDSYRVSHTGLVYLINRDGKLAKVLPPATNGKRYAAELERIIDAR